MLDHLIAGNGEKNFSNENDGFNDQETNIEQSDTNIPDSNEVSNSEEIEEDIESNTTFNSNDTTNEEIDSYQSISLEEDEGDGNDDDDDNSEDNSGDYDEDNVTITKSCSSNRSDLLGLKTLENKLKFIDKNHNDDQSDGRSSTPIISVKNNKNENEKFNHSIVEPKISKVSKIFSTETMSSLSRHLKPPSLLNKLECNSKRIEDYFASRRIKCNNNGQNLPQNFDSVRIDIETNCLDSLAKIQAQTSNDSGGSNSCDYPSTPENPDLYDTSSSNSSNSLNRKIDPTVVNEHDGRIRSVSMMDGHNQQSQPQSLSSPSTSKKQSISTRLSILGKPLPVRKEISYLRERLIIYNLLHRPKGFWPIFYHLMVILTIVIGLILFALSTVPDYYHESIKLLQTFDALILGILIGEFIARTWSSSCVTKYQGWFGAFRFSSSKFRLMDIFIIFTSATVLYIHQVDENHRSQIDFLRFAQAFQVLRISHRFRPWRIMASVIWTQRKHLAIAVYMCTLSLILITFTVYFAEHTQPNTDFTSIPKTLWWGVISLLTIGYGDMVPTTTTGKFLSSILLLICFSTFALPAGILGTGLALKVQEQQRQKHFNKRRDPAARLIQCAWRCYASSENSRSTATWKVCLIKKRNHNRRNNKLAQQQQSETGTLGSMVDLKLLRKIHRLVSDSQASLVDYSSQNRMEITCRSAKNQSLPHRILERRMAIDEDEIQEYFSPQEKIMIRFIRILKYKVARKHFKNAFRPYDINDVIEQYSAGHLDVVGRVKNMQSKINSVQNGLSNVIKMCQDLNYIQYHQMERMEQSIQEMNENLMLVVSNLNLPVINHSNNNNCGCQSNNNNNNNAIIPTTQQQNQDRKSSNDFSMSNKNHKTNTSSTIEFSFKTKLRTRHFSE